MTQLPKIPDAETIQRHVAKMRDVCQMFDALNMTLDLAIAIAEADLQNSPLYVRRRQRLQKQLEDSKQQHSEAIATNPE